MGLKFRREREKKMTKKIKGLILISLALVLVMAGCGKKETAAAINKEPYSDRQFLMGTYVNIQIYDDGKEEVLKKAFDRVKELAAKITVNEAGSEVDEINAQAGIKPVAVDDDVYPLIKQAYQYSQESGDGFDMTIGPITQLWHIGFDDARKPEQSEIDQALALVHHEKVVLDDKAQTVFLEEKGMQLDLGAIAKGYITDEVAKVMRDNHVTTAIIDLGGNVYVLGHSPRKENGEWTVGIQDPNKERNTIVGSVPASNKSLVTSGIYERNLTVNGKMYHHLFNPTTGYPFENDIAGVTIISDQSIDGDALSTLVFALGVKGGLDYVNQAKNIEAIFVTTNNELYLSDGLTKTFSLNEESGYVIKDSKTLK